jgi:Domain of unknown function (DUF4386)
MSATAVITSAPISETRKIAVAVGGLFFFQLATFMAGSSLIQTQLDGAADRATLTIGVFLEMCSGFAVVAIGILMYRVLKKVNGRLALGYPIMRIVEFSVSAILAIYLLSQLTEFPNRLLWVYIPTGIGGVILNYLLFKSRMVPRPISVLGFIGYCLLLLVVPLDLLGAIDADSGAGLVLLAPGGLYEFLILPVWLIARGFRTPIARTV